MAYRGCSPAYDFSAGRRIVDGISDSALVTALRRQMTMASARQVATTGNLANIDTPGYKTKDVTFDQALGQKLLPLNSTYKTHIGATGTPAAPVTEARGLPERRDGNN